MHGEVWSSCFQDKPVQMQIPDISCEHANKKIDLQIYITVKYMYYYYWYVGYSKLYAC